MFEIYSGGTTFTQWTKGQKLIMDALPVGADVHFYSDSYADDPLKSDVYEIAETRDGEEVVVKVCDVPDILLTKTEKIEVRVRSIVEGRYGARYSIVGPREKRFEVEAAEKPDGYVYPKTGTPIDPSRLPDGYPYKESEEVTVFKNNRLTGASYQDGLRVMMDLPALAAPVEGVTYIVSTYEGSQDNSFGAHLENYEIVCQRAFDDMLSIGDPDLVKTDFAFMYDESANTFSFATLGNATSVYNHGVKITGVTETIHPMAAEYMPMLTSPNGTKYKLSVADDGTLSAVAVTE